MSDSYKIYASKDYVNERALPQDAGEYKQLVTDGEGKWVAEDRLAWKESGTTELLQSSVLDFGDSPMPQGGYYIDMGASPFGRLIIGNTYTVIWDGVEYKNLVAFDFEGLPAIGSPINSLTETLPFYIGNYNASGGNAGLELCALSGGTHNISVFEIQETIHPIPAEYLSAVGLFVVSFDSIDGERVSRKSCAEIMEAIRAGCVCVLANESDGFAAMTDAADYQVTFAEYVPDSFFFRTYTIGQNKKITVKAWRLNEA